MFISWTEESTFQVSLQSQLSETHPVSHLLLQAVTGELSFCPVSSSSPPHCFSSQMQSAGNAETSSIRTRRTGSHPLDGLFCTFFIRWENRTAQDTDPPPIWGEANVVRLRASEGLTAPSSSVFFIPVSHTSLQLWTTSSFQGSSLIKHCASPRPSRRPSQMDQREDLSERTNSFCSFFSAAGKGEMKYFWWSHMIRHHGWRCFTREGSSISGSWLHWDTAVSIFLTPPHLQKIAERGWERKGGHHSSSAEV